MLNRISHDSLTIDFVVEADRAELSELVQRVRNGQLKTNISNVAALDDAVAAFNRTERIKGKTSVMLSQRRIVGGFPGIVSRTTTVT